MSAAAREIELKLTGDAGELERLVDWAATRWRTLAPPTVSRVRTIYYDTPQLTLAAAGMAARLRQDGDRWLLTLKTAAADRSAADGNAANGNAAGGAGGAFSPGPLAAGPGAAGSIAAVRREWEIPLNGPDCSPAMIEQAAAGLAPAGLADSLAPRFETAVTRTRLLLAPADGVAVEVAVDRGAATTADAQAVISEIELELKQGPVAALYDMALDLLGRAGLRLSSESKADLGLRLLTGRAPRAVAAPSLGLSRLLDADEARRSALRAAARHLLVNLSAAADHDDAAAMAEMHTALRRLRTALRPPGGVAPDPETVGLLQDRRRLAARLSDAPGWERLIARLRSAPPAASGGKASSLFPAGAELLQAAAAMRRDAGEAAARSLRAPRFNAFMLTLARRGETGGPAFYGERGASAVDAAAAQLTRLSQRCRKPAAAAATGDVDAAGRLRRRLRRLRDAAEAARGLFPAGPVNGFIESFAPLLERLEAAHDAGDAARRLDELAHEHPSRRGEARRLRLYFTAERDESLRAAANLCKTFTAAPLRRV